jgi:hypothetical protein
LSPEVSFVSNRWRLSLHAAFASIALFQEGLLDSNDVSGSVQRCERGSCGTTRSQALKRIRQVVGDLVGVFIKDSLGMNQE